MHGEGVPFPQHTGDLDVCCKTRALDSLLVWPGLWLACRYLTVLPLLPSCLIRQIFKLQDRVQNDDGLVSIYNYFHDVWLSGHPMELWRQNASTYRTNNYAVISRKLSKAGHPLSSRFPHVFEANDPYHQRNKRGTWCWKAEPKNKKAG